MLWKKHQLQPPPQPKEKYQMMNCYRYQRKKILTNHFQWKRHKYLEHLRGIDAKALSFKDSLFWILCPTNKARLGRRSTGMHHTCPRHRRLWIYSCLVKNILLGPKNFLPKPCVAKFIFPSNLTNTPNGDRTPMVLEYSVVSAARSLNHIAIPKHVFTTIE